jgi:hypothetical protein
MGATQRISRLNPKSQKNYWNTKSTKKKFKKTVFRTLIVERSQKWKRGTRRNLQARLKFQKKKIGRLNQPIRTKTFPKRRMFSTFKKKWSQKCV